MALSNGWNKLLQALIVLPSGPPRSYSKHLSLCSITFLYPLLPIHSMDDTVSISEPKKIGINYFSFNRLTLSNSSPILQFYNPLRSSKFQTLSAPKCCTLEISVSDNHLAE